MIIVDSHERSEDLWFMLDDLKIPYIKKEICFYECQVCGAIYFMEKPSQCGCNSFKDTFDTIQAGDFTNEEGTFLAERKSEEDLYSSIMSKRLFVQMNKMAMSFKGIKVLMLEGFLSNLYLVHPQHKSYIESTPAKALQYGVSFFQCDDIEMLIKQVLWLEKECGHEPENVIEVNYEFKKVPGELKLVCNMPGVGMKKGMKLLEMFKTPMNIFNTILNTNILYTKTGNVKGVDGPFADLNGFGPKFIQSSKKILLGE